MATQSHTHRTQAVLFDMDGTLIDSTPAVNATWRETCTRFGLDYDEVVSAAASAAGEGAVAAEG
jgi:sugar-phosphatase